MSTPAAQVRELEVTLASRDVDVCADVSFEIERGEILGLVGESGSGKTTVALALMGHARRGLRITHGTVRLDDDDLLAMSAPELRRIRGSRVAYVAQDPASALNPALTIGRQLREALETHRRVARDSIEPRVTEALREVQLDGVVDVLKAYPHQLSGGQQQRVMLAMAFAGQPELIIFDEPTTGLDVSTQRHVLETIQRLCADHSVAGLYVSHDLAVVAGLVQAVGVMYGGRLVEMGPTTAVFGAPAHPYTYRLLQSLPALDSTKRLVGIEGRPPRPGARPHGCVFAPRCPLAAQQCAAEPAATAVGDSSHWAKCWRISELRNLAGLSVTTAETASQQATTNILNVSGLAASYARREVLSEVTLSVREHECVALVGQSGSGKTTLARCIAGLHRTWDGEIDFRGVELANGIRRRDIDTARAIQYVFQNPYASLNPRKTVRQLVGQPLDAFYTLSSQEWEARVSDALREAALDDAYLDRYPDQLSGGERQRVAIARAIVSEPSLLICDEVTSALDVSAQAIVIELLRRLQSDRGLSILFITHNLALVRVIAQRTIVLNEGRVVEAGATEEVLTQPVAPYTMNLLKDVPRFALARRRDETVYS